MSKAEQLKSLKRVIPKRTHRSHKGAFGRLLILSGSGRMTGCAILAALAALRSGVGILTIGFPKSLYSVMTQRLTETLFFPLPETKEVSLDRRCFKPVSELLKVQDVLALGPGLSRAKETQGVIRKLVLGSKRPLVIDADALFPFSGKAKDLKKMKQEFILTPHAGEFHRLYGFKPGTKLTARIASAKRAALQSGGVIVLKGHQTIVAEGKKNLFVNTTGNPGLAKGGTGDVLLGLIASFLAQGVKAFDAARLGVFVHGLAADLAVKKIPISSLLASDLIDYIPKALKKLS